MIIINSILFTILIIIAAAVLHKLIITKNGRLRKIMIAYFSAEILLLSGLLFLEARYGEEVLIATQNILCIIMMPKVIVKIIFYNYIHS